MAILWGAGAHEVAVGQLRLGELDERGVGKDEFGELCEHLRTISVLSDLERITPKRAASDIDGVRRGAAVMSVVDARLGHGCSVEVRKPHESGKLESGRFQHFV